jgi:F0F1-type ATP synthase assembly protein I
MSAAPPQADPDPDRDEARRRDRARQARAWAIALDPVYGIIAFGLAGYGIDHWQGTWPRWTGILAITGLVAGFYRFIREAGRLNKDNSRQWTGRPYRAVEDEPDADQARLDAAADQAAREWSDRQAARKAGQSRPGPGSLGGLGGPAQPRERDEQN